ncbi:MAG: endopeptidase La [Kiritimatiellae bacterium]|nr:endopeptidase La [Kiritimatiellia bacterium]
MTDNEYADDDPRVEIVDMEEESSDEQQMVLARETYPSHLPILPLNQRPVFPRMTVPVAIEDEALRKMLIETTESDQKYVGLVLARPIDSADEERRPRGADLYMMGVMAEILQLAVVGSDGPAQVLLGATERFRILRITQEDPHIVAEVEYVLESDMTGNEELKAYSLSVIKSIKDLIQLNPLHKEELKLFMSQSNLAEPGRLADIAAALTTADAPAQQQILEAVRIRERLQKVLVLLQKEINVSKLQNKISRKIEEKLSNQQREFFLREQLKAIKKELGIEKEGKDTEVERFQKRLTELTLSDEARERVDEELEKLKLLEPTSPEFGVTRSYLDWLTALPWGVFTEDSYDIAKAEQILNRDHYGLEDVKERILEFLAVGRLKGGISGSILCFVGPPGVGKTSIGQSIARSVGRNFFRFSVGGIRDEAEIKGHRRTYIGALPGKFIQVMKTCKSANPVIMIDEIDKIGASYQGDPASALLEVLDPEQNRDFLDHYLDVRFDLSNVFFICTANQLDTIPRPLLDRMEVIRLSGYILKEKLEIARRYLVPKQLKEHGLTRKQLTITSPALRSIIDGYAREPGVRGLENAIKKLCRKTARKIVEKKKKLMRVMPEDVGELLGKKIFTDDHMFKERLPGVVLGLAWTSMGGDTLYIEATAVATGKPGFKQTGQLGDVMIESSEIAYTYVRALLSEDKQARDFFGRHFVHLHVPAGATPKDGPSAGITMAAAIYSLVKGVSIRVGVAMTGELTLKGRVIPIGGLKEKTIAAKRAKIKHLVFPEENRKDFDELPEHIRKGLTPHYAESLQDVLDFCFPRRRSRTR